MRAILLIINLREWENAVIFEDQYMKGCFVKGNRMEKVKKHGQMVQFMMENLKMGKKMVKEDINGVSKAFTMEIG